MNMKRMKTLALVALMVLSLMLTACGGNTTATTIAAGGKVNYKVTVIDPSGKPMNNGVAVKFMQNGTQKAMAMPDSAGLVQKEMEKGDYNVELQFTDTSLNYAYDKTVTTLSATKTELEIHLMNGLPENSFLLSAPDGDVKTYDIPVGMTKIPLNDGIITYYVFTPKEQGYYEIKVDGEIESVDKYGTPFYVGTVGTGEKKEGVTNAFYEQIHSTMIGDAQSTGTVQIVIGIVGKAGTTEAVLSITRLGDFSSDDPAYAPYTPYTPFGKLPTEAYKLPEGAVTAEFDLKSTYTLVLNEEDGYYHLDSADGPLVLVRLGKQADSTVQYILPSFQSVAENSGFSRYYYDTNGEFTHKINFGGYMMNYFDKVDEATGLFPMDQDLRHMILEKGEGMGWWDETSPNYLFTDENGWPIEINVETAWLFNCVWLEQN